MAGNHQAGVVVSDMGANVDLIKTIASLTGAALPAEKELRFARFVADPIEGQSESARRVVLLRRAGQSLGGTGGPI